MLGSCLAVAQINIPELQSRAAAGDAEAHSLLGNAYVNGQGVERDIALAISHYESAAAAGFAAAAFNLGLLHEVGRGVPLDLEKAFRHYLRAAELGFPPAQFNVGNMYGRGIGVPADPFQATIWMRRAADADIPDAQYNLGVAYETGTGVKADISQAIHWYEQAMNQGFPRAAYNLALLYEEGTSVERDSVEAARLYRIAADMNYGPAQNNLAVMYAEGRGGLRQSLPDAYGWFVLAAENGSSPRGRDVVAQRLDRVARAEAEVKLTALRNRLGLAAPVAAPNAPGAPPIAVEDASSSSTPAANAQLSTRLAELEAALNQLRRENTGLISANQALARQKKELEQRAVQSTEATGAAQAEIAHINEIARELSTLENIDPARRSVVQQAVILLERISRDNLRLNSEVKNATLELSSLGRRLRVAESQVPAAASGAAPDAGALLAAQDRAEQLDQQLAQARARIQGLESGMAAVAELRQQVATLTAQNEEISAQLAAAQNTPAAPAIDPADLRERDEAMVALQAEVSQGEAKLRTALQEVESLQLRVNELRAVVANARERLATTPDPDQYAALEQQVSELQEELLARDASLAALQSEMTPGEETSRALETSAARISELTAELTMVNERAREREAALASSAQRLAEFETAAAQAEQALAAQTEKEAQSRSAVAELTSALQSEKTLREQLETQVASARTELAALTSARRNETSGLSAIQGELAAARKELAESDAALAQLTSENEQLRVELRETTTSTTSTAVVGELEDRLAEQAGRLVILRDTRDQAQSRIADLTQQLSAVRTELADQTDQVSTLETQNQDLHQQLASRPHPEAVDVLNEELERITTERDTAMAETEQFRKTLESTRGQLADRRRNENDEHATLVEALTTARDQAQASAVQIQTEYEAAETKLAEQGSRIARLTSQLETMESELERAVATTTVVEEQRAKMAALVKARDAAEAEASRISTELAAARGMITEHRLEIETLNGKIVQLSDQSANDADAMTALSTELDTVRSARDSEAESFAQRLAELEAQLQSADRSAEIAKITAQRDQATAAVADLESALLATEIEQQEKETMLMEARSEIDRLGEASVALQDELQTARLAADQAGAEAIQLREELAVARAAGGAAEESMAAELSAAQTRIAQLDTELGEWRRLAAAAESEATKVQTEMNRMTAEHAAEMENYETVTSTQMEQLVETETVLGELRGMVASYQADLADKVTAERAARERIKRLETDLAKQADHAQIATELRGQLAAARSELVETERAMEQQAIDWREQLSTMEADAGLRADELAAAQLRVSELETGLQSARQQVGAMEAQLATAQMTAAEVDDLQGELVRSQTTIESLERELDEARAAVQAADQSALVAQLEQQQQELDQRNRTLAQALDDSRLSLADREEQLNALRGSIAELESELVTAWDAAEAQQTRTTELDQAHQSAVAEATRLAEELATLQGEYRTQTSGLRDLEKAWASADAEATRLFDELARSTAILTERETVVSQLQARNDQLLTELSAAETALAESQQADDATRAQWESALVAAETARDEAMTNINAQRGELDTLQRELAMRDDRLRDLERAERENVDLVEQIGLVQAELSQSQRRHAALEEELVAARQALEQADQSHTVAALQQARDTAVATAMEMGEELSAAEVALRENGQVIAELTGINDQLQTELATARSALEEARSSGPAAAEIAALENARNQAQEESQRLQQELTDLEFTLEENGRTIAELTGVNDRLQADVVSTERALAAALVSQAEALEEAGSNAALNMEVATLHNRVRQLEGNIAAERASAAKEFAALSGQLQRARETNQSLIVANRALLAARDTDEASTADTLSALEQEIAGLATTADHLRAENLALQTALAEAAAAPRPPADWERNQQALSRRLEDLQNQLSSAENSVAGLTATNAELRDVQTELEARLSQTRAGRDSSDARAQDLSQRVADLESQLTIARSYQNSVNQFSAQTEELLAENLALQTALTEARRAPRPPADWQNQRGALTSRIESLETELAGAQALDATVRRLNATNQSLLDTQANLESQLVEATHARNAEAARSRAMNQRIADLQRELTSAQALQNRVDQLAAAQDDLQADNQALQTALAEARSAPKPPADWAQQRQALTTRIEALQGDLNTAQGYEETVAELMNANQALLASQGILEVRIADSDAAYQNANARAQALEDRLAELDVLPDQLNEVQGELTTLQGDYDAVSQENQALAAQVAAAQTAATRQQQAAQETWTQERTRLRSEIEQLRRSADELASRSSGDQEQLNSLLGEVAAARSRITTLENQLTAAGEETAAMSTIEARLQSAERELRSQRSTNSQLQSSLTAERRTHESRFATLERENTALNTRLRQAQNTLDQIAAAARVLNPGSVNVAPPAALSSVAPTSSLANRNSVSSVARTHVVTEGDSLTRISMLYYGTPTRWREIYQANRETLSAANALRPGQQLRIP